MTTTIEPSTPLARRPGPVRWHRPLVAVAALMALLALFALVARSGGGVEVTGLDQWDKPLKFSVSIVLHCLTWSWLVGQLQRFRRLAWLGGTVVAVALVVEMVVITWAAATGTTSHFNVATPLNTGMWTIMAVSISILWVATFVLAVLMFFSRLGDRARTVAIRAGALISVVGLGLGYLMTMPTAAQLADFQGVAGAHTVGLADGGPGLPVLGWSTVAGDLRIPHFVGMHALQALPLTLVAIELASRRVAVLREAAVRAGLVLTAAAGYAGLVALVTIQALRGQSIVAPDAWTAGAGAALVLLVLAAATVVLVPGRRRAPADGAPARGTRDQDGALR